MNDTDLQTYDDGGDDLLSNNFYPSWRNSLSFSLAALTLTMFCVVLYEISTVIKARAFTFNLYIIFLLVPDCLFNFIEGWRCIGEGLNDGRIPWSLCYARNFMIIFYYYSNVFMNALIACKVYKLVVDAYHCKRTKLPTARRVALEACSVYLFAALVAGWFVMPLDWGVVKTTSDPYYVSSFGTPVFNQYLGICISVAISLPPFFCVFGVTYKVHKQKLLPLQGSTRALALYFMRIIVVFIAFYFPMLTLAMIVLLYPSDGTDSNAYFWLQTTLTMINPIQNMVTLKFLLQKDDIRDVFFGHFSAFSSLLRLSRFSEIKTTNDQHVEPNAPLSPKSIWKESDTYEKDNRDTINTDPDMTKTNQAKSDMIMTTVDLPCSGLTDDEYNFRSNPLF